MPVKNSSGRGFCAGFWNRIRRTKNPSKSEQDSSLKTQSAAKTNLQTPDEGLNPHEHPPVGELTSVSPTEQPSSDDSSLWNHAYNVLEEQDPDGIFKAYHDILSRLYAEFRDDATSSPPASDGGSCNRAPDLPSLHDPVQRRELLIAVTNIGLQQMKDQSISLRLWGHELRLKNAITDAIPVIEGIQKIVQNAVKDVPYAAAAMAGVSLVLPLLLNPSIAENDHRKGFDYVTSQMGYYIEMEVLFLPAELQGSLRDQLKQQIQALYENIIEFEIRSVLHFFSSRITRFFKGTILFDDWKGKLDEIQKLENMVQQRLSSAVSGESMKHLESLKEDANMMRQKLDIIIGQLYTMSSVWKRMERLKLGKMDQEYLAALQATDSRLAKRALESSKEKPLLKSYTWILCDAHFKQWQTDQDKHQLWISGDPGKGKTMLLCGVIDEFMKQPDEHLNVSFFFCQATDAGYNNANAVVRGLLCMLVKQQPALMAHIRKSCQDGMGKTQSLGTTAWEALSEVFIEVLNDPILNHTYLIIDALDECVTDQDSLLKLVLATSYVKEAKWLVSSRNDLIWPHVGGQELFGDSTVPLLKRRVHLKLEDKQDSITTSIDAYISNAIESLRGSGQKKFDDITVDLVKHHLVQNAEGTFLWVALVCKALAHPDVLVGDIKRQLASLPKGLKPLYSEMLKRIRRSEYESLYQQLLSIMTAVFRPLTFMELRALSSPSLDDYDDRDLEKRISRCGSFLTVEDKTVRFVHKSAKDYLLGEGGLVARSSDWSAQHYTIFLTALKLLTSTLRRDMCKLDFWGPLSERDSRPDLEPLTPISYAAVFWLDHFRNSAFKEGFDTARRKEVADLMCNFIREKYIYWLEALSLLGNLSHVMGPLNELSGFMASLDLGHNRCLVEDAYRFLQLNKFVIEEAPMQVYISALLFSPAKNLIYQICKDRDEGPEWLTIQRGTQDDWNGSIRSLGAHQGQVTSLAFSHDSQWLASGSLDKTIRIWDVSTGDCLTKINCGRPYKPIAFRGDDLQLVSYSQPRWLGEQSGFLALWNTRTGAKQRSFEHHNGGVTSYAWSKEGQRLALVSGGALQIWDIDTKIGNCLTLHKASGLREVAISSDSRYIAASGAGSTLNIWELGTNGYQMMTAKVVNERVRSLTFLNGSGLLALTSGNMVEILAIKTLECQSILQGHDKPVLTLNYCAKNQTLASTSDDRTLKLWDTRNNCCLRTFSTQSLIGEPTLSHDNQLAAFSMSKEIHILDMSLNAGTATIARHKCERLEVVILNNGQNFMTLSADAAILWDAVSGDCLHTYTYSSFDEEVRSRVGRIYFEPYPVTYNNQRQVVLCDGNNVILWDTCSSDPDRGAHLTTLGGHDHRVEAVAISVRGHRVVSQSLREIKVWDVESGEFSIPDDLSEQSGRGCVLAISADGRLVSSMANDGVISVWDTETGHLLATKNIGFFRLENQNLLLFSPNGQRLAFLYDADSIETMNVHSKDSLRFENCASNPVSMAFSDDGHRIVSLAEKTVKIWDCSSGQCLQTFNVISSLFASRVSFDPQNNDRLLTNIGALEIPPLRKLQVEQYSEDSSTPDIYLQHGISQDSCWIVHRGRKVCWIPNVYRSYDYAVKGPMICVIACRAGLAWSATLKLE